jgi:hypothetical protein
LEERMEDDPRLRLKKAADAYDRERTRMSHARDNLVSAIREANAGDVKKVEIVRVIRHVWSRQWVDQILRGEDR